VGVTEAENSDRADLLAGKFYENTDRADLLAPDTSMLLRTYACMHARMRACMLYVCMYACMHVLMYASTFLRMHVCMHVCMFGSYFRTEPKAKSTRGSSVPPGVCTSPAAHDRHWKPKGPRNSNPTRQVHVQHMYVYVCITIRWCKRRARGDDFA